MLNIMLRLFGERALHKAMNTRAGRSPLDIKFGFALLRDKRVPFKSKLMSLAFGVGMLALLLLLQIPLEAIATFLAPVLLPLDFLIDGLELVALPVLFTAISVAHIAPRATVDALYSERLDAQPLSNMGNVIDVESYAPTTTMPVAPVVSTSPQVLYAGSRRA